MSEQSKVWLVSFDTDRIKNYIFATNSLKEIRGASAILVEQDNRRSEMLNVLQGGNGAQGEIIYSAGGGGAFLVNSTTEPIHVAEQIERDFREATQIGSITTVYVPLEDNWENAWFGKNMDLAAQKLQWKKSRKAELGILPVEPYIRLCDACGYRPAESRFKIDKSGDLLCKSCAQKREKGMQDRQTGFVLRFKEHARQSSKNADWQKAQLPKDLNHLGRLDGSGYIGFLMLDGNQMGKLLNLMPSKDHYKQYSNMLSGRVTEIVFEVLEQELKPLHNTLPFEIVLIGGDDVMLFTTASAAPFLAAKILARFQEESKEILTKAGLLDKGLWNQLKAAYSEDEMPISKDEPFLVNQKLSMAGGLVICHANYPVPAIVDIAESLQKNAKKYCAEKDIRYSQGAIDFQIITSSATDLELARTEVPHNRPYSLSDLEKLLGYVQAFQAEKFPKNQLQMLYDACHRQPASHGTMAALHTIGRLKKRSQRELLRQFFQDFSQEKRGFMQWPWNASSVNRETGKRAVKTALVDLMDLYDYIK